MHMMKKKRKKTNSKITNNFVFCESDSKANKIKEKSRVSILVDLIGERSYDFFHSN